MKEHLLSIYKANGGKPLIKPKDYNAVPQSQYFRPRYIVVGGEMR